MKVILYMATTPNGFIAKPNDDTSWISKEEWNSYRERVQKAGAMIIGRRTYHILTKQPEFEELKDVKIVVVSTEKFETLASHHVVAHSPKEALEIFKDNFEVVVAGGGMLNASFMNAGLIDEIYVDVEPIVFSKGISLFQGKDFEYELEFLGSKKIGANGIQLHYRIIK